jgi:hypothetical protein
LVVASASASAAAATSRASSIDIRGDRPAAKLQAVVTASRLCNMMARHSSTCSNVGRAAALFAQQASISRA